jgi:hypothetical protein
MSGRQLSAHFYQYEFERSMTAARMGRPFFIPYELLPNVQKLCVEVLEPFRRLSGGRVVTIISGYRPLWLNDAVGGSKTSDHLIAAAADIVVEGMSPRSVCQMVQRSPLPIKQCILEFGEWTHLSCEVDDRTPRREFLTARKEPVGVFGRKKTIYYGGIL